MILLTSQNFIKNFSEIRGGLPPRPLLNPPLPAAMAPQKKVAKAACARGGQDNENNERKKNVKKCKIWVI
jgi:hypothetical protein